ncbi:MAG: hypothetical protein V8T87_03315 [Victivallales bacterium]
MVFTKMHGAGNHFILVDDSELKWSRSPGFIAGFCDRHLGVGGDGIIYLRKNDGGDVIRMDYYNSDGSGAVCGNGLRCSASFAYRKGLSAGKRGRFFLPAGICFPPRSRMMRGLPSERSCLSRNLSGSMNWKVRKLFTKAGQGCRI